MSREINIKLEGAAFTSNDIKCLIDEINREIEDGDKIQITPTKIDFVVMAVLTIQFVLLASLFLLFAE